MHIYTYRNRAPQIMEVCVAAAVPARKPFECPLPVQTEPEDRENLSPAHAASCVRAFQQQACYSRRPSLLVLLNPATEPTTRSLGGKAELLRNDAPPWGKTLPPSLQPPCPATSDSAGHLPQPLKHMGEWSSCPRLGKWHLCHCNGLGEGLSGRAGSTVGPALKVGLTHRANCQQSLVQQRTNLVSRTVDEWRISSWD